jgi:hypothetical protein
MDGSHSIAINHWLFFDLTADHPAYCRAAYRSHGAIVAQHRPCHATHGGSDCRIFLLRRHVGASSRQRQAEDDASRFFPLTIHDDLLSLPNHAKMKCIRTLENWPTSEFPNCLK